MLYVNPVSSLETFRAEGAPNDAVRQRAALEELDHLFAFTLLQEMRKTVPSEGLFGQSNERRTYEEMLDDALAGQMAKTGQLGIGRQVEAQLATAARGAQPFPRGAFAPLHPEGQAFRLDGNAMALKHRSPMALPLQSLEQEAIPLIKAPMKFADN